MGGQIGFVFLGVGGVKKGDFKEFRSETCDIGLYEMGVLGAEIGFILGSIGFGFGCAVRSSVFGVLSLQRFTVNLLV